LAGVRRAVANFKPAWRRTSAPVAGRLRFPAWLAAAGLALLILALYWPAARCAFVNYDDPDYVTANVQVQKGLTWENIKWAWANTVASNWNPLTVLSHQLDCQLFGLNSAGHHLTSVLLHALNGVLVFVLLRQLTGALWRSLLAATLFAVHPLRVESVVWIAERKDVLSGCFGLLALIFYARFAQCKSGEHQAASAQLPAHPGSAMVNYWLVLGCFALGLMSKAMLVTWPFLMLLLDYWPLKRFAIYPASSGYGGTGKLRFAVFRRLVIEKIPFFALAAAASVVTFNVQQEAGAMSRWEQTPFGACGENAVISYCRYLGKLFWPTDLAVLYPYLGFWPLDKVLLAGVLLAGISILVWVWRRSYPFLLTGWLWFCGTLVPAIGLVQVGEQSMADRYTYLPSLGIHILAIWGAYELAWRKAWLLTSMSACGVAAIVGCLFLTRQQLSYWQDTESLFRHAVEVTEDNYVAHNNLGSALNDKGRPAEAVHEFQEAIRLKPDFALAHYNLGNVYGVIGNVDGAILQLEEAIRLEPDRASFAHCELGEVFDKKGQTDEAIRHYQEALRLQPDLTEARTNLEQALNIKSTWAGR
jgi:tetratricopeptide (TPR) repeat protein